MYPFASTASIGTPRPKERPARKTAVGDTFELRPCGTSRCETEHGAARGEEILHGEATASAEWTRPYRERCVSTRGCSVRRKGGLDAFASRLALLHNRSPRTSYGTAVAGGFFGFVEHFRDGRWPHIPRVSAAPASTDCRSRPDTNPRECRPRPRKEPFVPGCYRFWFPYSHRTEMGSELPPPQERFEVSAEFTIPSPR